MDKSDIEILSPKQRYLQLSAAAQIALQYALIVVLWQLLAELLQRLFAGFAFFSAANFSLRSNYNAILFIAASTGLVYFLLRHSRLVVEQTKAAEAEPQPRTQQNLAARADELSRLLSKSQGVNAQLEDQLADQTAITLENTRLHEEAGQIAILEERQRLGRELHDSVTQALYSMMLFADATRLALAAGKQTEATENLSQVRKMARQAMADMRLLIYQLHPPLLKKEGLAAALQTRLDAVESRAGLQTEFNAEGDCQLPPTVEGEFYSIAQEVLNNVIKHAKAEHVTITLRCAGTGCCLTITDDGIGFDVATAQQMGGVGLRNLAERAQQIEARLTIESRAGKGTKVQVEV